MKYLPQIIALLLFSASFTFADVLGGVVSVAGEPIAIAVNEQTNRIYVACRSANTVTVIDGNTYGTSLVPVGTEPIAVAVNPVTNKVYVANYAASTVTVIDGATNATQTLLVGSQPTDIAVNTQTDRIYVTNNGDNANSVSVINGITNAVTTVSTMAWPISIAINEVTNKIYIGHDSGSFNSQVTLIDGATNTSTPIPIEGGRSYGIAVNPITNKVYATSASTFSVYVITEPSHTVQTVIADTSPRDIAVDPVRNKIYAINNNADTMTVIDGATNSTINVPTHDSPWSVAVNPNTGRVYVGRCGSPCLGESSTIGVYLGPLSIAALVGQAGSQRIAVNKVTNRIFVTNSLASSVSVVNADDASITGRVLTPTGLGLRNTTVVLTGPYGIRQVATTSSFGVFTFTGIITRLNYTVSVQSKRYRFAPQTRLVNESITNLDMIGLE